MLRLRVVVEVGEEEEEEEEPRKKGRGGGNSPVLPAVLMVMMVQRVYFRKTRFTLALLNRPPFWLDVINESPLIELLPRRPRTPLDLRWTLSSSHRLLLAASLIFPSLSHSPFPHFPFLSLP
jgi:hypothetical protein